MSLNGGVIMLDRIKGNTWMADDRNMFNELYCHSFLS